jgi:hypothetical protein
VESEGQQMKQCKMKYFNKKNPPLKKEICSGGIYLCIGWLKRNLFWWYLFMHRLVKKKSVLVVFIYASVG